MQFACGNVRIVFCGCAVNGVRCCAVCAFKYDVNARKIHILYRENAVLKFSFKVIESAFHAELLAAELICTFLCAHVACENTFSVLQKFDAGAGAEYVVRVHSLSVLRCGDRSVHSKIISSLIALAAKSANEHDSKNDRQHSAAYDEQQLFVNRLFLLGRLCCGSIGGLGRVALLRVSLLRLIATLLCRCLITLLRGRGVALLRGRRIGRLISALNGRLRLLWFFVLNRLHRGCLHGSCMGSRLASSNFLPAAGAELLIVGDLRSAVGAKCHCIILLNIHCLNK